jgi:serine/threonine protein kinase
MIGNHHLAYFSSQNVIMAETTQFGGPEKEGAIDGALKPNTLLLGRYKVTGVIGGGGQGAVYQARDMNFPDARRLVAVKEMHVTSADVNMRASTMRTFQREANILATLSHPAIPKIYDFFDQNDRAYLVMEYINGSDLEALLVKTKKLPIDKIVEWAIEICDVLHYLHSYQPEPIIFRDLKPANIMIDSLGKVRLIDFGIAKIFVSGIKHTQIGTEGYSAPEQYKGNVTPVSDIYSLGATLHHVVTREDPRLQPPFSFAERPIKQYNADVPPQLISIIEKALAFEAENRWQSCQELKQALEAFRYRPQTASAFSAVASATAMPAGSTPSASSNTSFFEEGVEGSGIKPKWMFKTEDEIRSSPSAFATFAYVGSYDTNLWAVSLETGEFAWKKATEGGIASSPVVDTANKQVLFGSDDYGYYAVDHKTGRIHWSFTTSDKVRSTGRIAHGNVFFGSDDGNIYAILVNNGREMWRYDTGAPIRTTPAVTNDRVIVGNEAGELLGLELNGARKWAFRTKKAISSSPFVDLEGVCYVGAFDGFLYAIDASSGYSHWRFRTNGPIISSPLVEGNIVYFGSGDGKFYAVNTQTSKEKWSFDTAKPIVSSPALHDGIVYFGGTNGVVYALDSKNGKEVWSYTTGGPVTSTPFVIDTTLLVGSFDCHLYAFPIVKK